MNRILYPIVFVCGLCSMAIEMTASRMISNVFSSANLVWACVIGSILIYLALGNWLGDVLSEKKPDVRLLAAFILAAGVFCSLIPLLVRPVLYRSAAAMDGAELGFILALFAVLLLMLSVPMTLLGMVTPFAIRLANLNAPGKTVTSGKFLAVSTLGSFLGTLLPVFWLIPYLGTNRSFFLISALLICAGLFGLLRHRQTLPLLLLLLLPMGGLRWFPPRIKNAPLQIYEKESTYNYIEVLQENGYSVLKLNDGQGIQSIYHPTKENYYGPWEQMLTAPFFLDATTDLGSVKSAVILGLAGGTSARQLLKVFPEIQIDGYEIDPEVVQTGIRYFALPVTEMTVHTVDGRIGLHQSGKRYDILMVDAYQTPYIAVNMCTAEFFEIVRQHLTDQGVLVMNVGSANDDKRLLNAIAATVSQQFSHLFALDIPNAYNSILFATNADAQLENLQKNYDQISANDPDQRLLIETLSVAIANSSVPQIQTGDILTDDHAPVELLTNQTILNAFMK